MNLALYPTILTPFTNDNVIDFASLDRFISHLFKNHCDGLFAVCQSSEMFYLSEEEKLELARFCIDRCHQNGKKCLVSGHTQDMIEDQIHYLQKLSRLQADAVILVTNRLAGKAESDEILIENLKTIISQLDPETRLGLYECPYPYKRLLSGPVIDFLISTGRFDFIKDTSCQIEIIRSRLRQIKESTIRLYNANAATLMESIADGAAGYSGVMLNFIPELFSLVRRYLNDETAPPGLVPLQRHVRSAAELAEFITLASVYEYQKYPLNAKHYLVQKGIFQTDLTRCTTDKISESQHKELLALANRAEKTRSKVGLFSDRLLIFPENQFFNSCHASTVLPLEDGTILVSYFAGSAEGQDDVGIWLSKRVNGHWQDPKCIAKIADEPHWNPVLFLSGGFIRLVFRVGRQISSWKSYTMVSEDQGETWTKAVPYPFPNEAGGPVRSKPIRLSNGLWLAPNSDETEEAWLPRVDISYDEGASFPVSVPVPINRTDPKRHTYLAGKGAIQPTLWESRPGFVHLFLRTTAGFIFRSDSTDDGQTWCEAYNTYLPNNNSGIDVAKAGSDLYLALNPISGNWASRNPLVVWKSADNGLTFDHALTLDCLETDPHQQTDAEYAYPAAVTMNGKLFISYTYLRRQIAFCEIALCPGKG